METAPDKPEIWLVDDNEDILASLAAILGTRRYTLRTFSASLAAIHAAAHQAPSLVISDLLMPECSGLSLIRHLRRFPHFKHVPILVLTALTGEEVLVEAFEAGADDYIHKPFNIDELLGRVAARVRTHKVVSDLEQRNRDGQFLLEMSRALNASLNLRQVLAMLVQRVADALAVDRCSIILVGRFQDPDATGGDNSPHDRTCRLVVASDNLTIDDMILDIDAYPEIDYVVRTRESLVVEDIYHSPLMASVREELRELGVRSLVLFPMTVANELVGVLFLRNVSEGWAFDPHRHTLAQTAANVAANAIRNAQMYEAIVIERRRLDRALRELRKTQDFLTNLIDASVDAIVSSDIHGKVVVFNKAAEAILHYTAEEAIGHLHVRALYPDDGARQIMRLLRDEAHGGHGRLDVFETTLIDAHGKTVPVSISAAIVYDGEGGERATMGIFTDLRERIRMEQELQKANVDLELTRRQAVVAELAGAAAHELNQPLTAVLGYAEFLSLRLPPDDANQKVLATILEQTTRMADIVKKIGRITHYRTKTYTGSTQIVDLDSASDPLDD